MTAVDPIRLAWLLAAAAVLVGQSALATPALTSADVLTQSKPSDWRLLDAGNSLVMQLASGRVVMELAPAFAPNHVANIKALVREGYFDGLSIVRAQDNYVVQWGDPDAESDHPRAIKSAQRHLPAEFSRPWNAALPFAKLPDGDVYAPEVGLSNGLPAARDKQHHTAWLAHCYGMVGVGRDNAADSGGGAELYVVIGHSPRHLDRNVSLVGRVVQGMDLLSTLPRGTGPLGFYEKAEQRVPIVSIQVAADMALAQRPPLEILRTDTPTFKRYLEARRSRREDWFMQPTGRIELCNLPVPVRAIAAAKPAP